MAAVRTLYQSISAILDHDPILRRVSSLIPSLGVVSRKVLLGVCQDERGAEERELSTQAEQIQNDLRLRQENDVPSTFDILQFTVHISSKPIYRSFISMLVRNEALDRLSGADETIQEGFSKEIWAGQSEREEELRLSYQCLDNDNFVPSQYSIYYQPTPWWTGFARNLIGTFASRLDKIGILFPQVQRRKNMSRDTCRNLYEAGYRGDREWFEYRTLDLELHKAATGQEIQGDCEMRMAWKFNDLKPRYYYCAGGSNYWRSRYMKKIAVELMECVESTKLERRMHPEDIQYFLQEDDYLAIWDMTSFTTQLSELKQFLYYIAKGLEDDIRTQQNPLQCLDYQLGIIEITADKLLLEYNSGENHNAPYSVWRVCDRIFGIYEEGEKLYQKNSGMLGVHGNIGFSTAFHGFHLQAEGSRGNGCGVGDDALKGMKEDPKTKFIPHLQLIGTVHPEKVDILPPLDPHTREQVSKFVKRRLVRTHEGISLGLLYAFPSLADVFNIRDEYHTVREDELADRIAKFVSQVGSFFWDIHASGSLDEDEYTLIKRVLLNCYRKFKLKFKGSLPGIKHDAFEDRMLLAVPSLDFDYCQEDWAEHLWENSIERMALLPQVLGPLVIPPYMPGMEFIANEGGMLNVLEDIGTIKKLRMQTEWVEASIVNRRLFRSFLSGEKRSYRCKYLLSCPEWFDRIFSDYSVRPYVAWI